MEEIEFDGGHPDAVLVRMTAIAEARDGWINLLPGVPAEEVPEEPRTVFAALFGTAQPPVTMCTWMPAGLGRLAGWRPWRKSREATVGVMHPKGRFAVSQLASMGVELPPGWQVRQDHARRGLIVHPAPGDQPAKVLDWMLRAGAALAIVPLTGTWKAQIYTSPST